MMYQITSLFLPIATKTFKMAVKRLTNLQYQKDFNMI